ncbi:MAG: FitA-like ribbon-helix-helix domain-containing protein [Pontimonas sp.]
MTTPETPMLAQRKHTGYGEGMSPNLLVRNVPTEIHATLVRRAEAEGKSLQEYVMSLLMQSAGKPTMAEVMAQIEANLAANPMPSMSTEEIVATIRAVRDA